MNFICFFYINNSLCKSDPRKQRKSESFPKKSLPLAAGTLNFFSLSATNKKDFESAKKQTIHTRMQTTPPPKMPIGSTNCTKELF